MKKIVLFICIICAIAVAGTVAILLATAPHDASKFSKNEIVFTTITDKNGEFVSNKTIASGQLSYEQYKIKISNTRNTEFENVVVTHSTNVIVISQSTGVGIEITFQIESGENFYFTVESDNFETATMMYDAREYIQADSLKLKVSTSPTGPFEEFEANSNNFIYIIDQQYKSTALADGFPSELWVIPYSTTHSGATFTTSVAESGHLNLDGNGAPYRLTAKSAGSSQFQFFAQDGSAVGKYAIFACKYVSPTGISGLPSKIEIDMSSATTYFLPNFTVLPVYAQNFELTFEGTNPNVFTFENNKITAVANGTAELLVKIDNQVKKEIPVIITFTQQPEFTFNLNSITAQQFAGNISLAENTLTLNLDAIQGWATLKINVGIANFGGTIENITKKIADPNNILFAQAGAPSFEIGDVSSVVFTINLSKTVGSLSIKFSKIIDGKTISKTLVINIINN